MNVDLGIWGKLTRAIVILLALAAVLGVVVWYLPLIRQNERVRKRDLELETQIKQEEKIQEQLKASVKALEDPRTVERLARERLGYARTGETVIRFEAPATNPPPVRR